MHLQLQRRHRMDHEFSSIKVPWEEGYHDWQGRPFLLMEERRHGLSKTGNVLCHLSSLIHSHTSLFPTPFRVRTYVFVTLFH